MIPWIPEYRLNEKHWVTKVIAGNYAQRIGLNSNNRKIIAASHA